MRVLTRLAGYLGPYWRSLIVTSLLILASTGLSLLPPLFQRQIIDDVIGNQNLARLTGLIAGLIGIYALAAVVDFGQRHQQIGDGGGGGHP